MRVTIEDDDVTPIYRLEPFRGQLAEDRQLLLIVARLTFQEAQARSEHLARILYRPDAT